MIQQTITVLLILAVIPCFSQRPFYAGLRPIGYPDTAVKVESRFREDLPPQLNGDVAYANRLDQLPVDQQPSWYVNRKQYNDLLKNPQTYPLKPSSFNDNSLRT